MFRITEAMQPYPWGSESALHELFGRDTPGLLAEAWLGAHASAPSRLTDGEGSLLDVIVADRERTLGPDVVARFGAGLPYLLKVLAAERPLSLQVHPHLDRARAGYDEEDAAGVPLDAPHRSFRDRNHKPELVYAITQFEALCGFRAPRRAAELFAGLDGPLANELHAVLAAEPSAEGIRAAFTHLLEPATRPGPGEVAELASAVAERLAAGSPSPRADRTVALLQAAYPGDPGVVTSLLLNPVTLRPGEAMFIPAGGVHAYLHGVAVELMANSDNVLRAGLTPKHVDVPELLRNVDYVAAPPIRIAPETFHGATKVFYAPVDDFELSVTDLADDERHPLPGRGPRILLCLDGEVAVAASGDGALSLTRGQAAFVPAADGRLTVRGSGRLVQADVARRAARRRSDDPDGTAMKVFVQIPCLDEAETLPAVLASIPEWIAGVDELEILVVDDGSTDRTSEVAREHGVRHVLRHTRTQGLARSFRDGVDYALRHGADIVVNTDGDNQYPQDRIGDLIAPIVAGEADIVVADRQTATIEHFSPFKKLMQRVGSAVVSGAADTHLPDAASGFRAYSRGALMRLNIVTDFSYSMETIIQAGHKRLRIASIPVTTNPKTRDSRLFRSSFQHMRRSASAIVRSYLMYKPYVVFVTLAAVFGVLALVPMVRFLVLWIVNNERAGNVQSLIFGAIMAVAALLSLALGVLSDLQRTNRALVEEQLERIKEIQYGGTVLPPRPAPGTLPAARSRARQPEA